MDTSAWFALLYEKAQQRPEATLTFAEIERGRYGTPVTTDYVLDETFTLLRLKAGMTPVVRLSTLLRASPSVRRVRVGEATFEDSLKLMLSRPDQRWSFTDCTSFVIMRETHIPRAFTWDHNFAEAGFEILPSA
ncbi:MAG: PIN domain-containing protein [Thermoplasmata archaeon]|nr:PIN domain-containing protein [Thermoplasmata archaeon]